MPEQRRKHALRRISLLRVFSIFFLSFSPGAILVGKKSSRRPARPFPLQKKKKDKRQKKMEKGLKKGENSSSSLPHFHHLFSSQFFPLTGEIRRKRKIIRRPLKTKQDETLLNRIHSVSPLPRAQEFIQGAARVCHRVRGGA